MIVKFNLKTPGREPEGEDGSNSMLALIIDQPMGRDPGRRAVTEEPLGVEPEPVTRDRGRAGTRAGAAVGGATTPRRSGRR